MIDGRKQKIEDEKKAKDYKSSRLLFKFILITRVRFFFCLLSSVFCFLSSDLYACPMCKEAISRMGEIWLAVGLNWSIYLMMAMPFILIGSFGTILYLNYRKHHHQ